MRWPTVDDLLDYALDQPEHPDDWMTLRKERWLLSACIHGDHARFADVWFLLGPGDFLAPVHACVWAACLRLRAEHRVNWLDVAKAVERVPGAVDCLQAIDGDSLGDELDVMLSLARCIREASVGRALAARDRAA